MERNLQLKGANNARELGGLLTKSGQVIRPCRLIRSNNLAALTDTDADILTKLHNVCTVIDLRTDTEQQEKPDRILPGVTNLHIPIFTEAAAGMTREEVSDKRAMLNNLPDMAALYRRMVTDEACLAQLRRVFDVIFAQTEGAVLWHCTAGKDRCGLVSALLLLLLGVPESTVLADYLLSNQSAAAEAARIYRLVLLLTRSRQKARAVKPLFLADPVNFAGAMESIADRHGTVEAFFKEALQVPAEQIDALRTRCLRDPR